MAKRKARTSRKSDMTAVAAEVLEAVAGKPPALTAKGTRTPAARLLARARRPRKASRPTRSRPK